MESLRKAAEIVARERVKGSSWALQTLARALVEALEAGEPLDCGEAASLVRDSFPGSGALYNLAFAIESRCGDREGLLEAARELIYMADSSPAYLREHSRHVLEGIETIVAISYSRAVAEALAAARPRMVYVLESRPGGEGVFAARLLRQRGLRVSLIPDSMAGWALKDGDAAALMGADAVGLDCCILNKTGSLTLAATAQSLGAPVAVVFEIYKLVGRDVCGWGSTARRTYRVEGWGDIAYPVLEEVPQELVNAFITDRGAFAPSRGRVEHLWRTLIEDLGIA